MKNWLSGTILGIALGLLVAGPAFSIAVMKRNLAELATLSEAILVGTVTDIRSDWDPERTKIHTYVTLSDLEVIKGEVAETSYVLRHLGGMAGGIGMDIPGMPRLSLGRRYLLFIRGNNSDFFPIVGIQQGVFLIERDTGGQRDVVLAYNGEPVVGIADDQPVTQPAQGGAAREPLTLREFVGLIRSYLDSPGTAPGK
ncbi:MAG TPA: hypothetical protein VJ417_04895 [Candidatus Glassbacteria bacterium]|nr:hypothetical protein [Candidatus Glassbacteria bacterium]